MAGGGGHSGGSDLGSLVAPSAPSELPEFDITAMVDLVSLMNIYFLITLSVGSAGEIDLPRAVRSKPLDADNATVITVVPGRDVSSVIVYLGDGKEGKGMTDPTEQEEQIAAAVDAGLARQKTDVLIKAEKTIRLREMRRISAAASREGVTLNMAVWEKDAKQ
ncbi:MAG: biopolymer transporter ExbD [Planctomycetaceae bacterium]|nr:biopolymer transporter ExbD [Planctomycetaceae bacterium]